MSCHESDTQVVRKELGDRQGETLQVPGRKYIANSCFDIQHNDFQKR